MTSVKDNIWNSRLILPSNQLSALTKQKGRMRAVLPYPGAEKPSLPFYNRTLGSLAWGLWDLCLQPLGSLHFSFGVRITPFAPLVLRPLILDQAILPASLILLLVADVLWDFPAL